MSTRLLMNEATLYGRSRSGVARYLRRIAQAAAGRYGRGLAVCSAQRIAPPPSRWIPTPRFRGSGRLHVQDGLTSLASSWLKPELYYGGYYGTVRTSAPEVFTVYDLIHDLFAPAQPDPLLRRALRERRRCFERATALIAISHHTAGDIVRVHPHIDPSKIVVTHLGVDELFFHASPASTAARPYFLFVGIRAGLKNFRRLVEAFSASGLASEVDLVVVSPEGRFTEEEQGLIRARGVNGSVLLRTDVSDEALAALYAGAVALVYPSEYEGFGLPLLEAMAAGTLVASSKASSLPEVGGTAAFYFDPTEVTSMVAALQSVVGLSPATRARRAAEGTQWARTFSWSRCQSQTLDLFDRLMSGERPAALNELPAPG